MSDPQELWRVDLTEGYYLVVTTKDRRDWKAQLIVYSAMKTVISSQAISIQPTSPTIGEKKWWSKIAHGRIDEWRAKLHLPPLFADGNQRPDLGPYKAAQPPSAQTPADPQKPVWSDMLDSIYEVKVFHRGSTWGPHAGTLVIYDAKTGVQLHAVQCCCYSNSPVQMDLDDWGLLAEKWVDEHGKPVGDDLLAYE